MYIFRYKVVYYSGINSLDDITTTEEGYVNGETLADATNTLSRHYGENELVEVHLKFKDESAVLVGTLKEENLTWSRN